MTDGRTEENSGSTQGRANGSEESDLADAESHGIESSFPIFKKKFESDVNPLIL